MKRFRSLIPVATILMLIVMLSVAAGAFAQTPTNVNQPNIPAQTNIIGGVETKPHEFPSQAWIINDIFWCGGSLIDPSWVITAGHCAEGVAPDKINIVLGGHNRFGNEASAQRLKVDRVIVHEGFDDVTNDNDLALMHLSTPAIPNEFVQPVAPIEANAVVPDGTLGTIIGWGETGHGVSNVLMKAQVPTVNQQACVAAMKDANTVVTANMLCAGYYEGLIDSCYGDSGGPLLIPMPDGSYRLLGITSWGIGCAIPKFYGVYTRVQNYIDWINAQIGFVLPVPTPGPAVSPTPTVTGTPPTVVPSPTPVATPTPAVTPTPAPFPDILASFYPNTEVVEMSEEFTSTLTVFNSTSVTRTVTLRIEPKQVKFLTEGWTEASDGVHTVYLNSYTLGPEAYIQEEISWKAPTVPYDHWVFVYWDNDQMSSGLLVKVKGSMIFIPVAAK
ncbi:serine protease [Candidatus Woesebacteria bacterium]|nr:serine protease [Candidatus Woesebacteria bacterium]